MSSLSAENPYIEQAKLYRSIYYICWVTLYSENFLESSQYILFNFFLNHEIFKERKVRKSQT